MDISRLKSFIERKPFRSSTVLGGDFPGLQGDVLLVFREKALNYLGGSPIKASGIKSFGKNLKVR